MHPSGPELAHPGIWNPLPLFEDVQNDHQLRNIQASGGLLHGGPERGPARGQLDHPVQRRTASTRPPASTRGQAYVTALINAAMKSPDWDSTAIFLQLGRLGGFYDGSCRRSWTKNGYGLRVRPGDLPYAKAGLHRPPDPLE